VTVRTTGWVGFGLSPAGGMANSNVFLSWTNANGFATLRDASLVNRVPIYDLTNNWRALYYRQLNGFTTVIVTRRLRIPGELAGTTNIDVSPLNYVVFAWGTGFNANGLPTFHNENRGSRIVSFFNIFTTLFPVVTPAPTTTTTTTTTTTAPVATNPPFIRFDESTVFANRLDLHPSYRMDWNTTATDFTFRLTVMTTGWVGFGLSPAGGMANSNVLLTWTQPNGFATMRDASLVNRVPIYDNTNNYKALYYRQVNGVTTVIASRLNRIPTELEGARDVDVTPFSNVVFAWGTGFSANGLPTYHNDLRGSRLVGLGAGLLPGR